MGEDTPAQLTEDEAKLYDRQIRLWGVESQQSLRNAKVLIIGMNGLGAEVAKNIILSGVKSVSFMDNSVATQADKFSQFLIPEDQTGNNRAKASVRRAQDLNPLVKVIAIHRDISMVKDEELIDYDVIIAIERDINTLIKLDFLCRENKIKFFAADVFGMFGYFFSDLQKHEYMMEVPTAGKKNVNDVSVKQTRTEVYPSFKEAVDVDFSTKENAVLLHRMEPSYFVFKMLMNFRGEHGRDPTDSEEDFKTLSRLRDSELSNISYPSNKISDDLIRSCVGFPVSPVCAIVGAMVSQEIIKAVSHRDHPNKNMFFFNPLHNIGHVQCLSA